MSWIGFLIGALLWLSFSFARATQQKQITELEKGIKQKKNKLDELESLLNQYKQLSANRKTAQTTGKIYEPTEGVHYSTPPRNTTDNPQKRPTEPRTEAQATQTPPKAEKPAESPPGWENSKQTETPRQSASQEQTRDRQKRKEDIINGTEILGEKGNAGNPQGHSQPNGKYTVENIADDFETLLNAGVFTDPKTGKQPRIYKGEDGQYRTIDTDDAGVPFWFKDMFEKATEKQGIKAKEVFFQYFESIGFKSDFDFSEYDASKLLKYKNIKTLLTTVYNDIDLNQASKEARFNEIYQQGVDVIEEFYPFFIDKNTGTPLLDYVLEPQAQKSKPTQDTAQEAQATQSEKPENGTKWGHSGETGTEKPKRGRGRPKKSQE